MAEVFRAETEPIAGITRPVAIKRIARFGDPDLAAMLVDEARIWVRLQHPNIVRVVDFGEEAGDWFLALELVEGATAARLIADGPLETRLALCIGERVARALAYAHSLAREDGAPLGIVHRDVKPANILVSTSGEVKLTDFGIARAADRVTRTVAGVIKGSVPFLSPEQVREEKIDGRSDLFSLGCTLHLLLTGEYLIPGTREAMLTTLGRGAIPAPRAEIPAAVRALIAALTANDPKRRPASAADVARQLRGMLLPESPEDLEPMLGALVRRSTGDRPSRGGATPASAPLPEKTAPAVPLHTVTRPSAPAAPEPATATMPEAPPPAMKRVVPLEPAPARSLFVRIVRDRRAVLLTFAILLPAIAVAAAGQAFFCRQLRSSSEDPPGDYARAAETEALVCRWCSDTPEQRTAAALARARAGDFSASAIAKLGASPIELRAAATIRVAASGWDAAQARKEISLLQADRSEESACLAQVLAFDTGLTSAIDAVSMAGSRCGAVLHGSERLAWGALPDAETAFEALPTEAGLLGRAAVAVRAGKSETLVESVLIAAARASTGAGDDVTGLWIASSWAPLPGEHGRLATPLDDDGEIAALVRGDLAARGGKLELAAKIWERSRARGAGWEDLAVRLADASIAAKRPDRAATDLLHADPHFGASRARRVREIRLRIARREYEEARRAIARLSEDARVGAALEGEILASQSAAAIR